MFMVHLSILFAYTPPNIYILTSCQSATQYNNCDLPASTQYSFGQLLMAKLSCTDHCNQISVQSKPAIAERAIGGGQSGDFCEEQNCTPPPPPTSARLASFQDLCGNFDALFLGNFDLRCKTLCSSCKLAV